MSWLFGLDKKQALPDAIQVLAKLQMSLKSHKRMAKILAFEINCADVMNKHVIVF